MKIKHSKYKNTGILFELLTRQITSDTVSGKSNKSLEFLKKHFNSKTELLKEYKIYHTLSSKKYAKDSQATMLIETLIEAHKNLNKSKLRREKYNLIKEIKDTYDVNNFFNSKISNYKIMASIYNLLENKEASPSSIVKSKINLLEHIILKKQKIKKDVVLENFNLQDKNTRLLTYKVILEKFNNKYSGLGENQQTLLKEYVNSVTNSPSLKAYINEEIKKVKRDITKYAKKITDKAVVIKLNETKGLIKPLCKKSSVHDDNVSNLLNYYELINELKTIHG
jgi:DNA repair ATPase RecN